MTTEIYNQRLKKIEEDYTIAKKNLYIEFGLSQAIFKVGDIIKDERWSFQIDKITVHKYYDLPQPYYHGYQLKADGTIRKDKARVSILGNKAELVIKK